MACNPSCFTYFLPESGGKLILNQTGTKLGALGKITIQPEADTITAELVTESEYETCDKETQDFVDSINKEFESVLNEVVAHTDVDLTTLNPETEERMVRSQETNLGDLCADAYRWALNADIGLVNGGGIRADIAAGDITYGQIINVHPYSNQATSVEATGQQILDALEMGAQNTPGENGGFLQVSGLSFTIDTTIESTVVTEARRTASTPLWLGTACGRLPRASWAMVSAGRKSTSRTRILSRIPL